VVRLAYHTYEWPKRMVVLLRDAADKSNTEHREFEDALKKRRSQFSHQLKLYQESISEFEGVGEKDLKKEEKGHSVREL
jgi:dynein heavy chain